ncbi:MAG: bifunctional diaminohydroxyphosphoribosylaminopyrimidine deaminase/5-amino-6-(5-phosphoribosylamino)uracil reductase RibD [Candidatus Diapherotrites archaeon]|nr:bifunctional diaminohydroxyphosphoribosylaminopyrimidine deaminase/5-amino-6-(5-phosphoribosylamino)uracil reductase RibD [Candidatus Diapherotrites archaeon]
MQKEKFMLEALKEANKCTEKVCPNPKVGCVIVKNGKIVGRGFHAFFGKEHAEVNALKKAGKNAKNAEVYVTLEPCSHYGKTPPCTEALIKAGVKKVFIGVKDPSKKVSGKGIKKLKNAGIAVVSGIMEKECSELIYGFKLRHEKEKPFIALKNAMSLDGKITDFQEKSKWISGKESLKKVQELRKEFDAVLVSSNTVKKDNPKLTCRIKGCENPIRIILDAELTTKINSKVYTEKGKTIVFCAMNTNEKKIKEFEAKGINVIKVKGKKINGFNELNLSEVVKKIAGQGINSVLVEGGSKLNYSFLKEKLVNKIYLFVAPIILGGKNSKQFVAGNGFELNKAVKAGKIDLNELGTDLLMEIELK